MSGRGGGAAGATARAARNTAIRGVAELVGKFATLALIVVLARTEGVVAVGVLVFALAWTELASIPIDMGFDRHVMRLVARDPAQLDRLFYSVLSVKALRAVPVVAASWLLLELLGYGGDERLAVYLLTGTYLVETVRWTLFAAFTAHERADLTGLVLVTQRLTAGALGLLALLLGYGVVAVAAAYVAGAVLAVALGVRLLAREIGLPRWSISRDAQRELNRESLPFAAQEMLSAGMARLDAVLLSVLATQAVVGLYGTAYRLLEATLFVSTALLGAFSAMYTYLDERSEPTIRAVYARSLKASLAMLIPLAVPFAVLAEPILDLLFGAEFAAAAPALRLLAPTVVLLGLVMLSSSLVASRLSPKLLVRFFGIAFVVNVGGNLALIGPLGATGAALAMLLTELVLAVILVRTCVRAVGAPALLPTAGSALAAGAAMALTAAALQAVLPLALLAGGAVYVAVFWLVERQVAPGDLESVKALLAGRLGRLGRRLGVAGSSSLRP